MLISVQTKRIFLLILLKSIEYFKLKRKKKHIFTQQKLRKLKKKINFAERKIIILKEDWTANDKPMLKRDKTDSKIKGIAVLPTGNTNPRTGIIIWKSQEKCRSQTRNISITIYKVTENLKKS